MEAYTGPSGGAHGSEWKEGPPGTEWEGHMGPCWRGTRVRVEGHTGLELQIFLDFSCTNGNVAQGPEKKGHTGPS
ncbi:hypothetical protein Y032_0010g1225 [Ancylostoma ceylanicum]|uniref:Uncharacterized protein n=1 Tax=Ancylostoma ceylanicum TaxID=53326 RepID=A0A016VGQ5_9BILA|nr:hypothetical protein Y032_0010g1225 [Ancylostoma ceylanicum]